MRLPRLAAFSVFTVAITSLIVLWGLFGTMWVRGEAQITVVANYFNEFLPEFVVLTLAIIFLPVLLYEADQAMRDD